MKLILVLSILLLWWVHAKKQSIKEMMDQRIVQCHQELIKANHFMKSISTPIMWPTLDQINSAIIFCRHSTRLRYILNSRHSLSKEEDHLLMIHEAKSIYLLAIAMEMRGFLLDRLDQAPIWENSKVFHQEQVKMGSRNLQCLFEGERKDPDHCDNMTMDLIITSAQTLAQAIRSIQ